MKNIQSTLTGLTASLFVSVGLTQIAEKLDPVSRQPIDVGVDAHGPAMCIPTDFTPKPHRK